MMRIDLFDKRKFWSALRPFILTSCLYLLLAGCSYLSEPVGGGGGSGAYSEEGEQARPCPERDFRVPCVYGPDGRLQRAD